MTDTLTATVLQKIQGHIDTHKNVAGALLPLLHAIQDDIGYIPEAVYPQISKALALSIAEVHGVVSFYHHFRTHAAGKHIVQICRAESCQSMGSEQLEAWVKSGLGLDYHQTSADGEITLLPVYCLGNCACSPAVMINEEVYGRVNHEKLSALINEATQGKVKLDKNQNQ